MGNWNGTLGLTWGMNSDDTFRVNHLIRNATEEHDIWKWRSSNKDEIHDVRKEHIISVKVKGEWFYGKTVSRYVVENWRDIQNAFDEHFAF